MMVTRVSPAWAREQRPLGERVRGYGAQNCQQQREDCLENSISVTNLKWMMIIASKIDNGLREFQTHLSLHVVTRTAEASLRVLLVSWLLYTWFCSPLSDSVTLLGMGSRPLGDGYTGVICSNSDKQDKILCYVCCSLQKGKRKKMYNNPPTPVSPSNAIIWLNFSEKLILTLNLQFTSQTLYILSVKRNPSLLFCNLGNTVSDLVHNLAWEYLDEIRMHCIAIV